MKGKSKMLAAVVSAVMFFSVAGTITERQKNEETVLEVHFIDVGQGDATLITCNGEAMLIDAGDNDKGTHVQNYLNNQGISSLKYVIGTHPDADHIGGLDVILYKYDCETVIMPEIEADTESYRDVEDTMKEKGYRNEQPIPGDEYILGDAVFTIISPSESYEDRNNSSVAIILEYKDTIFLFAGDAEEEAEYAMVKSGRLKDVDVYKVSHHGSSTSSNEDFLNTILPEYAVISCGEDNSYGHPHAEVLNSLRLMDTEIFRTDEQGTIVAESDGRSIIFSCSSTDSWLSGESTKNSQDAAINEQISVGSGNEMESSVDAENEKYICNTNTMKFHYPECSSALEISPYNRLETDLSKEALIEEGYLPCGNCKP